MKTLGIILITLSSLVMLQAQPPIEDRIYRRAIRNCLYTCDNFELCSVNVAIVGSRQTCLFDAILVDCDHTSCELNNPSACQEAWEIFCFLDLDYP